MAPVTTFHFAALATTKIMQLNRHQPPSREMAWSDWLNIYCRSLLFKRHRSTEPVGSPLSQMAATFSSAAELQRALTEQLQASAVKSFMTIPTPPEEARASVVLLEGEEVDIQLTTQGYTVNF